ncbi:MAG: hypothetical protein QXK89_04895 [Candidatus Bathyarchaeia archaeon]
MRARIFRLRLPLAIFILLILSFLIAGSLMMHITLMSNSVNDGNWFLIKTESCELKFPKKWYVEKGSSDENGTVYIINLFSEDFKTIMHLKFYSKAATLNFMGKNNLTSVSLVPSFEVQRIYNWSLKLNENATLYYIKEKLEITNFIEKWAETRNYEAYYSLINIKDAYKSQDTFYNTTGLFVSLVISERLIEIIFYGEEVSWGVNQEYFKIVLDSMKIMKIGDLFESE